MLDIRLYVPEDCEETLRLFYDTVHTIAAMNYTKEQINVWAPEDMDREKWNNSFLQNYSIVAVDGDIITGFGIIDDNGYLDKLYVHKQYQRCKVAKTLVDQLENYALNKGASIIITEASITAKGFFLKRGYQVVKEQQVERQGVLLTNFVMEKPLK